MTKRVDKFIEEFGSKGVQALLDMEIPMSEAAPFLGKTPQTLARWDAKGTLKVHCRDNSGRRRYKLETLVRKKKELEEAHE